MPLRILFVVGLLLTGCRKDDEKNSRVESAPFLDCFVNGHYTKAETVWSEINHDTIDDNYNLICSGIESGNTFGFVIMNYDKRKTYDTIYFPGFFVFYNPDSNIYFPVGGRVIYKSDQALRKITGSFEGLLQGNNINLNITSGSFSEIRY